MFHKFGNELRCDFCNIDWFAYQDLEKPDYCWAHSAQRAAAAAAKRLRIEDGNGDA